MSPLLADTTFVEATWILVVKSIVIFAVIFAIVPMLTVLERKLLGRFQAPLRAEPGRPRAGCCSRSPTP